MPKGKPRFIVLEQDQEGARTFGVKEGKKEAEDFVSERLKEVGNTVQVFRLGKEVEVQQGGVKLKG